MGASHQLAHPAELSQPHLLLIAKSDGSHGVGVGQGSQRCFIKFLTKTHTQKSKPVWVVGEAKGQETRPPFPSAQSAVNILCPETSVHVPSDAGI